jgi:hypothetical protein
MAKWPGFHPMKDIPWWAQMMVWIIEVNERLGERFHHPSLDVGWKKRGFRKAGGKEMFIREVDTENTVSALQETLVSEVFAHQQDLVPEGVQPTHTQPVLCQDPGVLATRYR